MESIIENLDTTTFLKKRFTRKQIALIQDTVKSFPGLARRELGQTICELLNWKTPAGTPSIQACLTTLEQMEELGLFELPDLIKRSKPKTTKIKWTEITNEQPNINVSLDELMPIRLQKVTEKSDINLWNEYIDRYHYLGYRRPIGSHLRYFIISEKEEKPLGCLSFSFGTSSLPCRDQWIGWNKMDRSKFLHFVINNNRFLILPWVKVEQLASKSFSLVGKQLANDWQELNGYQPILLETFVDPDYYKGTCYLASNWKHIGKTAGRKPSKSSENQNISQKEVFVYPLRSDFRAILTQEKKPPKFKKKNKSQRTDKNNTVSIDDPFVILWQNIMYIVQDIGNKFDKRWQKRKRVLNTMLIILFIFRLVFSKNKQGYNITINELWDQCRLMKVPLPQSKPVAASAFCKARIKLDEEIFKDINNNIITIHESNQAGFDWKGHRIFAVDGTKMNLPRKLHSCGYPLPSEKVYYPQALVSCLYQLKSQIPYDFNLVKHSDERKVALEHLQTLKKDDVIVYDRGYFSYMMLYHHIKLGIHPVFRIQNNTLSAIEEFISSNKSEALVTVIPSPRTKKDILEKNPGVKIIPLKIRVMKYVREGETYIIGTTLFDREKYTEAEFQDVYHSRWGIEELYKISKILMDVEDFHGHSERGVRQELFAHFVLITINRLFANKVENDINKPFAENEKYGQEIKVNNKNSLITIARNLEAMFLQQATLVAKTLNKIFRSIINCKQKCRPERSFERISRRPEKKWRPGKKKKPIQVATT